MDFCPILRRSGLEFGPFLGIHAWIWVHLEMFWFGKMPWQGRKFLGRIFCDAHSLLHNFFQHMNPLLCYHTIGF